MSQTKRAADWSRAAESQSIPGRSWIHGGARSILPKPSSAGCGKWVRGPAAGQSACADCPDSMSGLADLDAADGVAGLAVAIGIAQVDGVDDVHAGDDAAEDGM
jgi:hypothetical protein